MNEKEIIEEISKIANKEKIPVYLVGGSLRDRILRRRCHDLDFVCEGNALTLAKKVARHLKASPPILYRHFGAAMLKAGKVTLEFATSRKESYSPSSRKPDVLPASLKDDIIRRDFTINSLAQRLGEKKIVDLFGGREDIKRRLIRTTDLPDKTFFDDPLRMLRAVRFASQLNFQISDETKESIKKNKKRMEIVSQERIAEEIIKIIGSLHPEYGIRLLDEVGLLEVVLPEISNLKNIEQSDDFHCKDVFRHTLVVLQRVSKRSKDRILCLAALCHDIGKPATQRFVPGQGWTFYQHQTVGANMAGRLSQRLFLSREERERLKKIIFFHLRPFQIAADDTEKAIFRFVREVGRERKDLFILARADMTSKNPKKIEEGLLHLQRLEDRMKEVNKKRRAAKFSLSLNGNEIMAILNIKPGPKVGKIKKELEEAVIEGKVPNRKRALRYYLRGQVSTFDIR